MGLSEAERTLALLFPQEFEIYPKGSIRDKGSVIASGKFETMLDRCRSHERVVHRASSDSRLAKRIEQ